MRSAILILISLTLAIGCGGNKTPASSSPATTALPDAGTADSAGTMNSGTPSDKPEGPDAPQPE